MDYLSGFIGEKTFLNSNRWGSFAVEAAAFSPAIDGDLIIHIGEPLSQPKPLVRIHSVCLFSEVLDSDFCDCAEQFRIAMDRLTEERHGLLFYLRFEARGAGLAAKIKATALEMKGIDTYDSRVAIGVSPESRDFASIGHYLKERGVDSIRLLTNNPLKIRDLESTGIEVASESLVVPNPNENVKRLLRTKAEKFQHRL